MAHPMKLPLRSQVPFEEGSRGTIEAGKLADLTIVDGDLYAMPPSELFKTKVRMTVVGGAVVYGPTIK